MEKNKTGKYFKYAIGEIILVMIGILLALQVNNWNEEHKVDEEEINVLKELKASILTDIQQLNTLLDAGNKDVTSSKIIIEWLDGQFDYNDSLSGYFTLISRGGRSKLFTPQNSAYKVLESKGVDLISNDSLKNKILELYNIDYSQLNFEYENYRQNIHDYGRPIARSKFRIKGELATNGTSGNVILKPIDYKELSLNPEFYNIIKVLQLNSKSVNGIITKILKKCQNIVNSIDKEIKK